MKSLFYSNHNNLHQQESAKTGLKFKNFLQEPPGGDNEKPTRSVLKEKEGEKKGMEGRRMEGEKWRQAGRGLVLLGPSENAVHERPSVKSLQNLLVS